jgi:hypothetical protein
MKPIYKKLLAALVLLWGGSVIVLLSIHMFLMMPQQKESRLLDKQLMEKRLRYNTSKAADNTKARARLAQKVEGLTTELEKFAADVEDLDDLSFSISKIAAEIGVEAFKSKGVDPETYSVIPNCNSIGRVSIEIDFIGSFNKFARFVNRLERYEPVVFVDEFVISTGRRDSGPEIKMWLSIFVRVPEKDKLEYETGDKITLAKSVI